MFVKNLMSVSVDLGHWHEEGSETIVGPGEIIEVDSSIVSEKSVKILAERGLIKVYKEEEISRFEMMEVD